MNDVYRFLNSLTIGLIIFMFILAGMNFAQLPESIPIHFNGKGEIDGYGSKNLIWLMPVISLICYVVIRLAMKYGISKSPEKMRISNLGLRNKSDEAIRRITEYNYNQCHWMNIMIVAFFAYIMWVTIQVAGGTHTKLNPWILWSWVALLMVPSFKMIYFQLKTN